MPIRANIKMTTGLARLPLELWIEIISGLSINDFFNLQQAVAFLAPLLHTEDVNKTIVKVYWLSFPQRTSLIT